MGGTSGAATTQGGVELWHALVAPLPVLAEGVLVQR